MRFGAQTGLERVGSMLGFTSVIIINDLIKVRLTVIYLFVFFPLPLATITTPQECWQVSLSYFSDSYFFQGLDDVNQVTS